MNDKFDPDKLLERLFEPKPIKIEETLEELFNQRIQSLQIPKTTALKIMGMSTRTLEGIITGEQKVLDYTQLIKLSNFLGIDAEEVVKLYIEKLRTVHDLDATNTDGGDQIKFINEHFNLAEMRKVGLISSLTDYESITKSICRYFGLNKIQDYSEPEMNVAFSAGKRAKTNCSLNNWIFLAEQTCIELRNTNDYSRDKLIEYFPQIRWYCTDVDNGLVTVINHLFRLGITVVFIPSFPSMHIRGATFEVNNKPCIALTDYVGFYPTLWFALVHELYHVLFDWDTIRITSYHLSLERDDETSTTSQNEIDADEFARKYLFSKDKSRSIEPLINEHQKVKEYAAENHVDPSFIYVFSAFDAHKSNKYVWGRAKKRNPNITRLLNKLQHSFDTDKSFDGYIKDVRNKIYN